MCAVGFCCSWQMCLVEADVCLVECVEVGAMCDGEGREVVCKYWGSAKVDRSVLWRMLEAE